MGIVPRQESVPNDQCGIGNFLNGTVDLPDFQRARARRAGKIKI
jgi:hypothetical protein